MTRASSWSVREAPQESMSQSLSLSFEQENEALAKARKKNRLAQRKHRQKKKSLTNPQSQDTPKTARGQAGETTTREGSLSAYDHEDDEGFKNYNQTPLDMCSDHGVYATSPSADMLQDLSLQTSEISSMSPEIWNFSKDMGPLMSPSILSTASLDSENRIQRPSTDGCMPSLNSSLLPLGPARSDIFRPYHNYESEYNSEATSQAPFSNINNSTSPEMNYGSWNEPENNLSCRMGYKNKIRGRHNSVASYVSASQRSDRSDTSRWQSQTISNNPSSDHGSAINTPHPYVGASTSSSNLAPMLANDKPFPGYVQQSTPVPPTLPAETSQHGYKDDEVSRLERVLEAIDEAGFDSVDSMTTAYYTSVFPSESPVHAAQALSKKRHLRRLLAALHESAKSWNAQELQNFREGIMRSAEDILIDEMQSLDLTNIKGAEDDADLAKLESVLLKENKETTKEIKRIFKQQATETWSLLTELGNAMGVPPAQNAQLVSAFLSMLIRKKM